MLLGGRSRSYFRMEEEEGSITIDKRAAKRQTNEHMHPIVSS